MQRKCVKQVKVEASPELLACTAGSTDMAIMTHMTLSLDALAPSGLLLSTEQKAALAYSLPIKQAQAGLKGLQLWGKVLARNGKDYLVVRGTSSSGAHKLAFSQDAVKWADLEAVPAAIAEKAAALNTQLSGEPSKTYPVMQPGSAPPAEGEPPVPGSEVTELQRLRSIVDAVTHSTDVSPKDALVRGNGGELIRNAAFTGVSYPDKLESFAHARDDLPSLAADVRGVWATQHDAFLSSTVLRHLIWPGYCFFYNGQASAWGGLYVGTGVRNDDLIFML